MIVTELTQSMVSYRIYNELRALGYSPAKAWKKAYQL